MWLRWSHGPIRICTVALIESMVAHLCATPVGLGSVLPRDQTIHAGANRSKKAGPLGRLSLLGVLTIQDIGAILATVHSTCD
jgi:hypothetical protein